MISTLNSCNSCSFPAVIWLETIAFVLCIPRDDQRTQREKAVFPDEFSMSVWRVCMSSFLSFSIPRAEIDLIFHRGKKVCILRKICTPSCKKGLSSAGSSTNGVIWWWGSRKASSDFSQWKIVLCIVYSGEAKVGINLVGEISKSLNNKFLSHIDMM